MYELSKMVHSPPKLVIKLIYYIEKYVFLYLKYFSVELIIGFLDTIYSVSEADGFVLVKVGILNGSVANESVTVYFFAQDDSAIGECCLVINPRCTCAARVIVVVVCVCMYVCVTTQYCRLTHWNHKTEIPTCSQQYSDRFNFC